MEILFGAEGLTFAHEPLATLGESLALCRGRVSFAAVDQIDLGHFGAANMDSIVFMEVDARGQRRHTEFFAVDRLGDAVTRLYERYADLLPDGPARARAAATARSAAILLGPPDLDRYGAAFAPWIEFADHRTVGFAAGRGADALLRGFRGLFEVAADINVRVDEVFCLQSDALLVRWATSGTDRTGGGAYEMHLLLLWVFGSDGLLTHNEQFDVDRDDEALARFDALTAAPAAARFANAATRTVERFERCWRERDWDGVVATLAPTHRVDDRRALLRLRLSAEDSFASLRFSLRDALEPLALRAARHSRRAARPRPGGDQWRGRGWRRHRGGASQCHRGGRRRPAGRDRSLRPRRSRCRLRRARRARRRRQGRSRTPTSSTPRWRVMTIRRPQPRRSGASPPGQRARSDRFTDAWEASDWEALAALCAPGFRQVDRRAPVHLNLDRDAYLQSLRMMLAMRACRIASEVLATRGERLVLARWRCAGTDGSGGPSELEWFAIWELDDDGVSETVLFDLDDLDAAHADLDARYTAGEAASSRRAALTRAFSRAFADRDWDTLAALLAPDLVVNDHRMLGWETLHGPGAYVQALRSFVDLARPTSACASTISACPTPGSSMSPHGWSTREGGGIRGTECHRLRASTGSGRIRGFDQYDLDQLDEARTRLDAIGASAARDPLAALRRPNAAIAAADRVQAAFDARDWPAMRATCAPHAMFEDRRRHALVWGTPTGGLPTRTGWPERRPTCATNGSSRDRRPARRPRTRPVDRRGRRGAGRGRVPQADRGRRDRADRRRRRVRPRRLARRQPRGVGSFGRWRSGRGSVAGTAVRIHRGVQ